MARLKLLQPHEGHAAGVVLDLPGGIASVLAVRRIGVLLTPEVTESTPPEVPNPQAEPEEKPVEESSVFLVAELDCGGEVISPKGVEVDLVKVAEESGLILLKKEDFQDLQAKANNQQALTIEQVESFAKEHNLVIVSQETWNDLQDKLKAVNSEPEKDDSSAVTATVEEQANQTSIEEEAAKKVAEEAKKAEQKAARTAAKAKADAKKGK